MLVWVNFPENHDSHSGWQMQPSPKSYEMSLIFHAFDDIFFETFLIGSKSIFGAVLKLQTDKWA